MSVLHHAFHKLNIGFTENISVTHSYFFIAGILKKRGDARRSLKCSWKKFWSPHINKARYRVLKQENVSIMKMYNVYFKEFCTLFVFRVDSCNWSN